MSIESAMPSNHLILCRPLLLLPSIFPSIRVFSNESALHITWPKYWSFSFSINPSNEYSGLISFRIDWFDFLAVQGTLKSLLQRHISEASVLWSSTFFMVQLSYPVGALALGSPAVEPAGPWGGLVGGLQEGSHQWVLARTAAASVFVPTVSLSHLQLHRRPSRTSKQVWTRLLWGHWLFPWTLVHTRSVSSSRVAFLYSNLSGLLSRILWGHLLPLPDSQSGKPNIGLRASTSVGESVVQWFSFLWVTHLRGMGFDFVVIAPLLPRGGFFFVFGGGLSFSVGCSIVLVNDCSAVSFDLDVFVRRCELMSCSAILPANSSNPWYL